MKSVGTDSEAIAALQTFINQYPYSEFAENTDELIDELQVKLERKAYENAKLYFKIRRYEAALVAFDNFRKDYPGSKFEEEIIYLEIQTAYEYAKVSITERQKERFESTKTKYEFFVDKYPNSKYLKEAEQIYANSIEELSKFASRNKI